VQRHSTLLVADLATKINEEHQACCQAATSAVEHAMRVGDLLLEAKAGCGHGEWQIWLAEHFDGSPRTARAYMRLAKHRVQVETKRQTSASLSIDSALRILASPPIVERCPPDDEEPENITEGQLEAYSRNATKWWSEVESRIDSAGVNELMDIQREAIKVQSGWAIFKLRCERAMGQIIDDLDKSHGKDFSREFASINSNPEGHLAFMGACNQRIEDLQGVAQ